MQERMDTVKWGRRMIFMTLVDHTNLWSKQALVMVRLL